MLILSLRKKQIIRLFCIVGAFTALAVVIVLLSSILTRDRDKYREFDGKTLCLEINDSSDALLAAGFFGADTENALVSCQSITIPHSFNELYDQYNGLQRDFGSDLSLYKGQECLRYTIRCESAPFEGTVYTLLVCDGRLIGGDISDMDYYGSMTGLIHKGS